MKSSQSNSWQWKLGYLSESLVVHRFEQDSNEMEEILQQEITIKEEDIANLMEEISEKDR